ncbi:hypothetical protein [Pedobacter nototheniae]|uniref:hypothetical protein n=1 Tax=Pedobacter nototheniae TaxID=2488994 RepID=UPI00103DFF76|nr:hypothetical protein [Pedobacter nototheniae]
MARRKLIEAQLEGVAKLLKPKVYRDGDTFICFLDEDINESVLGRGTSLIEAVNNWDEKLKAHLRNAAADDPVVHFVKSLIDIPGRSTERKPRTEVKKPQHVTDFETQFYSRKK